MDPIDYGSMLTKLDVTPLIQGLQVGAQRSEQRARQRSLEAETALHTEKFAEEQRTKLAYQTSANALIANPTAEQFAAHALRFPGEIEAATQAWHAYTPAQQQRNMGFMAQMHGLISAGQVPQAIAIAEKRRAALVETTNLDGSSRVPEQTQETDAILGMLKSGDPKQIDAARGLAFYGLGIAAGPDKFAAVLNSVGGDATYTLSPGSKRFDRDNNPVANAPFAPDRFTLQPGETRYEAPGVEGVSMGARGASVDGMFNRMIVAESGGQQFTTGGRPLRSPKGAVGVAQVMPATGPEAAKLAGLKWDTRRFHNDKDYNQALGRAYFGKQLEDFQDPAQAAGAYNAGPERVRNAIKRGGADWLTHLPAETQDYVRRVTARVSQTADGVGSGARATASAPERPQAARMSADEVQAEGLDPATVYYRNKDGVPTAVGGQTKPKASGQPAYSQSAMDSFDRAIGSAKQLLGHKGLSAAVGSGFDPSSWGSFNPVTGETLAGTNAADFTARLNTLKAQVFLPMVQSMKGMGALSNAEGEKLTAAIGALDTKQSEGEFKGSLQQVIGDLQSYRTRAERQGGGEVKSFPSERRLSPSEAAKLAPGTRFIGQDGRARVRQ